MGTHGITAGTAHREAEDRRKGRQRERERRIQSGEGASGSEGEEGWGERKTRRRERGHDDRGRIMTIITIYMQVPSLPAHEQSTHSISYLI